MTAESDRARFLHALEEDPAPKVSAATLLEASIVLGQRVPVHLRRQLDDLVRGASIAVVPFNEEQYTIARQAYIDFGKGSGHSAGLNLGDCFAYALHRVTGEPLLFKGEDFAAAGCLRRREGTADGVDADHVWHTLRPHLFHHARSSRRV
ncbi:type II toxin-antitoxin system VapC family toxin [Ornithinimicrobium sp. INDO-MA30-4]|nr:type II toxin-antitoxin system VapC family toxin [Ornithinimicrobium sp. INDO-MA30-4]